MSEFLPLSVSLSVNRAKGNRLSGRGAAEEDEWKRGERDGWLARMRVLETGEKFPGKEKKRKEVGRVCQANQ